MKKGPGLILTGEVPPPVQKPRFVERPAADADDDSALALLQKRSAASATHKPKRKHMRTKKEARSTAEILSALQKHREAADAEDGEVAVKEEGEPDLKRKKGTVVAGQRILGSTKVRLPCPGCVLPWRLRRCCRCVRGCAEPLTHCGGCCRLGNGLLQRVETTGDVVDDDADLVASLARARRVAQKSNAMADDDEDQSDLGAQRIRAMIKSSAAADARVRVWRVLHTCDSCARVDCSCGVSLWLRWPLLSQKAAEPVTGLVLTDTVEFSRMLETRMLEKALVKAHDAEVAVAAASASAAAKATAAGAASAAGAGDVAGGDDSGDDDGVAAGGDVDMEEGEEVEQADDEQAKGSGSDDDDKQGAFEEINVGSGLASTLALLRRQVRVHATPPSRGLLLSDVNARVSVTSRAGRACACESVIARSVCRATCLPRRCTWVERKTRSRSGSGKLTRMRGRE